MRNSAVYFDLEEAGGGGISAALGLAGFTNLDVCNPELSTATFLALDVQHINNPGYNQVRGPLTIPGVRMHVEV